MSSTDAFNVSSLAGIVTSDANNRWNEFSWSMFNTSYQPHRFPSVQSVNTSNGIFPNYTSSTNYEEFLQSSVSTQGQEVSNQTTDSPSFHGESKEKLHVSATERMDSMKRNESTVDYVEDCEGTSDLSVDDDAMRHNKNFQQQLQHFTETPSQSNKKIVDDAAGEKGWSLLFVETLSKHFECSF